MSGSSYDRALTVFSPDGHLFQVEYAMEAVNKAVAIRGKEGVCLAVERKMVGKLQDPRTVRKIVQIGENMMLTFAGLQADARDLIDRARISIQSYFMTYSDPPKVEFIARRIAEIMQKFTQSHGVRPYGVVCLIAGHDPDGSPRIFECDPSGTFAEWKADSVGRSGKTVLEFLEKNYDKEILGKVEEGAEKVEVDEDDQEISMVKLAVKSLLEVVESGRSIEVAVFEEMGAKMTRLDDERVEKLAEKIHKEKEALKEKEGKGVKRKQT